MNLKEPRQHAADTQRCNRFIHASPVQPTSSPHLQLVLPFSQPNQAFLFVNLLNICVQKSIVW